MPLKRDIFPMSFGPDPVQAEFCISIIYGSYCGDGTDAVQRVGDRPWNSETYYLKVKIE